MIFKLKRISGQEATIWLELLFASLLSSNQLSDLRKLNPFLTSEQADIATSTVVGAIFHSNRIGLINRCIVDIRGLIKNLHSIVHNIG